MRYQIIYLVIAGVFVCILVGWVIAARIHHNKIEEEQIMHDEEKKWREEDARREAERGAEEDE